MQPRFLVPWIQILGWGRATQCNAVMALDTRNQSLGWQSILRDKACYCYIACVHYHILAVVAVVAVIGMVCNLLVEMMCIDLPSYRDWLPVLYLIGNLKCICICLTLYILSLLCFGIPQAPSAVC